MKKDITLQEAGQQFLEHLAQLGKKPATLYTYGKDIEHIQTFFGPDCKVSNIKITLVGKFYKSDILLKLPNGKDKAPVSIQKIVRVLRQMMHWLQESGVIESLPLPKTEPFQASSSS